MEGWIVALATMVAAGSAVWLAFLNRGLVRASQEQVRASLEEVRASQQQVEVSQEQLSNQERPVLVPMGKPAFQQDHDNWLDWRVQEQALAIRNLGTGTAFNVASVLCGCESYVIDSPTGPQRSTSSAREYWTCWLGVPIALGEKWEGNYTHGGVFLDGNRHIAGYSSNAPDEPYLIQDSGKGELWRVARVTLTYHDISGRKYASIFDYVYNRGWYKVAMLSAIEYDLYDLEGFNREIVEQSAEHAVLQRTPLLGS